MQIFTIGTKTAKFFGALMIMGLMTGCISGLTGGSSAPIPPDRNELAPMTAMVEGYGDIELPMEMTLVTDKSMAIRTESFQGGIHSYSGRVQIGSLKDYILSAMRNNQWKMMGEASYKNIMLAFTKPNKTCIVILSEGLGGTLGKTQADFYVTVDLAAVNKASSFGAPLKQ